MYTVGCHARIVIEIINIIVLLIQNDRILIFRARFCVIHGGLLFAKKRPNSVSQILNSYSRTAQFISTVQSRYF